MIRLAVISGKGGTGKTMITAALSRLLKGTLVLADCDVDAANLELVISPHLIRKEPFFGMKSAFIDPVACVKCTECEAHCRFDAVDWVRNTFRVNTFRCEGCAVCMFVCPVKAVAMQPRQTGEILYSETSRGHLVHARLVPGAGNSGLLVHAVKKMAMEQDRACDLFLIDGPPGTGCPLISTISGVDAVLVVTEPSVSGLHDLKRVVTVCRQFRPRIFVAVNRYDLDPALTKDILEYCCEEKIALVGTIPFDHAVIEAVRAGIPVTDAGASPATQSIQILAAKLEWELTNLDNNR
ncbi:MAG: ATP-binding protein [Methanoregula sp.]|uniref:ATP-binding protein n=1 Tax=Methanoregula sp. TaxID=2052170 RepID=UPI0025E30839|nr:ATP-binding protein [Methanoregula sp.]MCK9632227.1 ATP-binding protein [Methanoregula sp.]